MSTLKRVGNNLYLSSTGTFHIRYMVGPTREMRALKARTLAEATKEAAIELPHPVLTFTDLANQWQLAGCPNIHGERQSVAYCNRAAVQLAHPLRYFGSQTVEDIGPILVDGYFDYRAKQVERANATGRRTTDLELACCSAIFRWAYRRELVKSNPFIGRGLRQKESMVIHCTARAPVDADMVHKIASKLLSWDTSESCGWLWLWLCLTGCRCVELRELRLDGVGQGHDHVPGTYTSTSIVIRRAKMRDRDGAIQPIPLQTAAQALLPAWKAWHTTRHPGNPYWFPGLRQGPLDPTTLAHSLARVCKQLGVPKVQPHGARSFFCKVMRSILPDDRQVSDLLGHTSTKLVERIYGRRSPSEGRIESFLPSIGQPAWVGWLPKTNPNNVLEMPKSNAANC